jgi:hypothetical protein
VHKDARTARLLCHARRIELTLLMVWRLENGFPRAHTHPSARWQGY